MNFVALPVSKATRSPVKPSKATVAHMSAALRAALLHELSPESWVEVARVIARGEMYRVEDIILGADNERMSPEWAQRFLSVFGDTYVSAANAELARVRSGLRLSLFEKAKKLPRDKNRFTSVPHSDEHIRTRAASLVVDVTRDQRKAIRETILERYNREKRPETLVRDLKNIVGLDPRRARALRSFEKKLVEDKAPRVATQVERYRKELLQNRAETIARTESVAVEAKAKQEAWSIAASAGEIPLDAEQEWVASDDPCPICQAMDGMRVPVGDDFPGGNPPRHPNCVLGDALVSATGIQAVSERFYDGDIVIITLADGTQLPVTPNHPILSAQGWRAACAFRVGDDVLRKRGERAFFLNNDDNGRPTPARELAQAFGQTRKVTSAEVPVSSPDFHGDGKGSEIAVVLADSQLSFSAEATVAQFGGKQLFVERDSGLIALSPQRALLKLCKRCLAASASVVGSARDLLSVLVPALSVSVQHRFAPDGAGFDVTFQEHTPDNGSRDGVMQSELQLGRPGEIASRDVSPRQLFLTGRAQSDTALEEYLTHPGIADVQSFADRVNAFTAQVSKDCVVDVAVQRFRGHVYNLQTVSGAYLSQSLISHNCYCMPVLRSFR